MVRVLDLRSVYVRLACGLRAVASGSSVVQWSGHWFCVRLPRVQSPQGLRV